MELFAFRLIIESEVNGMMILPDISANNHHWKYYHGVCGAFPYSSLIRMSQKYYDSIKKVDLANDHKYIADSILSRSSIDEYRLIDGTNMIVHNDYTRGYSPVAEIFSDRIELTSYGGLVPGQSEEDFFSGVSIPRNRELMRVFRDLDLVEQLGSGMNRILRSYDRSIFRISEHFIRVAFPFAESPNENASKKQAKTDDGTVNDTVNGTVKEKIKNLLRKAPASTYVDIAEATGVSRRTVARLISEMAESGEIRREGSDKKGTWVVLK